MKNKKKDTGFWERLDGLIQSTEIVIDRPKDTGHPDFPEIIYPVDYGYLKGVAGGDGRDMDLWVGSREDKSLDAVVCTVDIRKKDTEIKLLLGCTQEEKEKILNFHNNPFMSGILIER